MGEWLREQLGRRPIWMNALLLFCAYMTLIYLPWDIFIKPVEQDQEVWFGLTSTGWIAKLLAFPHWAVYAAGMIGFWGMRSWMWPWASLYAAQVAFGMALWPILQGEGRSGGSPELRPAPCSPFPPWLCGGRASAFRPHRGPCATATASGRW